MSKGQGLACKVSASKAYTLRRSCGATARYHANKLQDLIDGGRVNASASTAMKHLRLLREGLTAFLDLDTAAVTEAVRQAQWISRPSGYNMQFYAHLLLTDMGKGVFNPDDSETFDRLRALNESVSTFLATEAEIPQS